MLKEIFINLMQPIYSSKILYEKNYHYPINQDLIKFNADKRNRILRHIRILFLY